MDATASQVEALRAISELDRTRMQSLSALEKLPYKQEAEKVRSRLSDVVAKLSQVQTLYDEATSSVESLKSEHQSIEEEVGRVQSEMEASQGDFRRVNDLGKELESLSKRLETNEYEQGRSQERLNDVTRVLDQATKARDTLVQQEAHLAEQYRAEGGALKRQADAAEEARSELIGQLGEELLRTYEQALQRCGGVAIASLDGSRCSVCRSSIDESRLLEMRNDAPLSRCPSCGRLVIVEGAVNA